MVPSRRGLLVGLLMVVTALAFEFQGVSTAMPAAAHDLGQLDLYAWAFTASMIPQIVAIILAGRLSDRVGPVLPLQIGVTVFTVGIVVCATAFSMPMLLAGRFVQGFGGGLVNLALMVLVGRAFPPQETGRVMTWFSAAWMLPSFVGPSASAAITRALSWHYVFWAVLPVVAVGAVLLARGLRGVDLPPVPHPEDAEAVSPVRLTAALEVALGVTLIQGAGQQLTWWSLPLAVAGGALLIVSTRRLMPAGWRPAGTGLAAVIGVRAMATGAFFGLTAFLPLMIVQLRGLDLQTAGLTITVASLSWTLGAWLQSQPWLRLSRDQIITAGTISVTLGLAVITATAAWPALPLVVVMVGSSLAGFGMGLGSASTSIAVIQLSDGHELGRNTGSLQVAESMGNAILAGFAGTLFAAFARLGDMVAAFVWAFAFLTVCAALSAALSRRTGHVANLSAVG